MKSGFLGGGRINLEKHSIEELLLLAFSYGLVNDGWFSNGTVHLKLGNHRLDLREDREGRAFLEKLVWGHELAVTLGTRAA